MRTEIRRTDASARDYYRLLTALVVPRPIAWVSSTSAEGIDNIAPHSFYTVASVEPPVIQFTSVGAKDTLRNVEEIGEFVVHLASEDLFEQVNATGTNFPPEISEFDAVGLTREPSLTVRPPRIREAAAALECRLHRIIPVGDCHLILGEVMQPPLRQACWTGAIRS
ncbi:flavin reductase family protein [Paenarthrobacter sp. PH39-S1]|uniref:flavin reductase family protein n=1 Tax=Paenarthrobacter sp. PH39-S1 TaxID=3046204 RepID=UPI0024BA32DC|nr:flavin reductase family protein [Paenarthrobacter sp. PH39-S1]MDJ0355229.1 flavin reductase family protein [Paenarthrobacter sp. PH39-S1]